MEELALHILDIVQNSITAGATVIIIEITEDYEADSLTIEVRDNGHGMEEEMASSVVNPFVTSRTTRKVGLGIPMFKLGAESCGGSFFLSSEPGKGTVIRATYQLSHIDRQPLGNMADTITALVICNPDTPDFIYTHKVGGEAYEFDTREIRKVLGEVPLNVPDVADWIKNDITEGINQINGGIEHEVFGRT